MSTVTEEQLGDLIERCSHFLLTVGSPENPLPKTEHSCRKMWALYRAADRLVQDAAALGVINLERLHHFTTWRKTTHQKIVPGEGENGPDVSMVPRRLPPGQKRRASTGIGRDLGIHSSPNIINHFRSAVGHVRNNALTLYRDDPIPAKQRLPASTNWHPPSVIAS